MATCPVVAIDSNITGLRATYEECPGVLPANPVWREVVPNSIGDTGGEIVLTPRQVIKEDRQNLEGMPTDMNASMSMQFDVVADDLDFFMPGFMFADWRVKPAYLLTGVATEFAITAGSGSAFPTLTASAGGSTNFITAGIVPGDWIFVGGDTAASQFSNMANNGFKRVRAVAAKVLTLDKSKSPMVADVGTGKLIQIRLGRLLKNEATRALIVKKSVQFEQTLGSMDDLDPPQSLYTEGGMFDQLTLNLPTANKMTVDMSFVAQSFTERTQAEGLKAGTRPVTAVAQAFNTSLDIRRFRLATAGSFDVAPTPIATHFREATLTINNGITMEKALGVFGAFDSSAGTFTVGGTMTAYFTSVEAIRAVRNSADLTLDTVCVKGSRGIIMDMPLVKLGGTRPAIAMNQKVTLPLTTSAVSAAKLGTGMNYTAAWISFDNLPLLASTL